MSFKIEKTKLSDFTFSKNTEKTKVHVNRIVKALYSFRGSKGSSVSGWCSDEYVYGVVYHKVRRKTNVTKKRNTQKSGCTSFYKRELVREAHWVTTVYKFPINRVKHFEQHKHHFDVALY